MEKKHDRTGELRQKNGENLDLEGCIKECEDRTDGKSHGKE